MTDDRGRRADVRNVGGPEFRSNGVPEVLSSKHEDCIVTSGYEMAIRGQHGSEPKLLHEHQARTIDKRVTLVSQKQSAAINELVDLRVGHGSHRLSDFRQPKQRIVHGHRRLQWWHRHEPGNLLTAVGHGDASASTHGFQHSSGMRFQFGDTNRLRHFHFESTADELNRSAKLSQPRRIAGSLAFAHTIASPRHVWLRRSNRHLL